MFAEQLCLTSSVTSDRLCWKELIKMKEILSSNSVSLQDLFSSICCYFYKTNLLPVYGTHVLERSMRTLSIMKVTKLISGKGRALLY